MSCFKVDFCVVVILHEKFSFMLFHGVINHLILVWDCLSTYFVLKCTVFSFVEKSFKQLRNINLSLSFFQSWHSCCCNDSISFHSSSFSTDKSIFLSILLLEYLWFFSCFLQFIVLRCKGNIKLDGVGPIDNRPSTDKLHHFGVNILSKG